MANKLSIFILIIGSLVCFGWVFDIDILKTIIPGAVPMQFASALSFIFVGAIFYIISQNCISSDKAYGAMIGMSLFILFLMSLLAWSNINKYIYGIENLFIIVENTHYTAKPGLPSLATIAAFDMIGIYALSYVFNSIWVVLRKILSVCVLGIGIVAIIGHIFNLPFLFYYFPDKSSAMSLLSAILFVISGFIGLKSAKGYIFKTKFQSKSVFLQENV